MMSETVDVTQRVKDRYGQAARQVREGGEGCCAGGDDPITADLYDDSELSQVPVEALQASLGCGNPTALAELHPGEVVLDLGSGGGIDVLLSARRVGPTGKVYGLDMTDEMLALAEENKARAGVTNAEFLRGQIESIPLPDESVDVIISNCVINLSADKERVFAEASRVLRPGGRFAVSDMVLTGRLPPEVADVWAAWTGCVAGALEENDYRAQLAAAGFVDIDIRPTRTFTAEDAHTFLASQHLDADRLAPQLADLLMSAFVRAVKP
jgi:SAM-dependent methyltransferase